MIDLLTATPDEILAVKRWDFAPGDSFKGGRFTVWEPPKPNRTYVLGADFAHGLEDGDYDAACVLDKETFPVRQVAELYGHWGQSFDRLLYAVAEWYGGAFIVGERQVGLPGLQRLYMDYGAWLYFDRDEVKRSRPVGEVLGYWRSTNDVCVPNLRRAVSDRALILRSGDTLDQMRRTQYAPRRSYSPDEKHPDASLQVKLAGGGSPDLVMAAAYAWHGINEVEHFPKEKARFAKGTFGHLLEHETFFDPERPKDRRGRVRR